MIPDTLTADTRSIHTLQTTAWWLYLFHAVCFLLTLGILSFIPLVLNYLARPKAAHTFVYSHHTWQIRSFWWYFVWGCIGSVLYITFIGIPGALIVWILAWGWYAYRLIAGFTTLDKHLPMPFPDH